MRGRPSFAQEFFYLNHLVAGSFRSFPQNSWSWTVLSGLNLSRQLHYIFSGRCVSIAIGHGRSYSEILAYLSMTFSGLFAGCFRVFLWTAFVWTSNCGSLELWKETPGCAIAYLDVKFLYLSFGSGTSCAAGAAFFFWTSKYGNLELWIETPGCAIAYLDVKFLHLSFGSETSCAAGADFSFEPASMGTTKRRRRLPLFFQKNKFP